MIGGDDLSRIQSGEGSKFNSSLSDLERIHLLLVEANHHSMCNDYVRWFGALDALDREISTYLNEEEDNELNKDRMSGIVTANGAQGIMRKKLRLWERKLRYFRSKKKLGIVAGDDASTAALR